MKVFNYTIKDKNGIHSRPAGMIIRKAGEFSSKITMTKDDRTVELNRLFGMMSLGVKCGDTVTVTADGTDESKAIEALEAEFAKYL